MAQSSIVSTRTAAIRETIHSYCQQRPQSEDILRAFQPLLEGRAWLMEHISEQPIPLHDLDLKRLDDGNHGVPLLAAVPLDFLAPWIELAAKEVMPLLQIALPDTQGIEDIVVALQDERLNLLHCCTAHIAKDNNTVCEAALRAGVAPELLQFTLGQILGPPLGGLAKILHNKEFVKDWRHGFCPVCGAFPSIATLARPEPIDLESLVGGGGQKTLHCSLCGNAWRFRRDACPACENANPGTREMIHVTKTKQERIEACTKCKAWSPCIDLREYSFDPDPTVAPLGLIHLAIIAGEKGYLPLAPAPWNTFSTAEALS